LIIGFGIRLDQARNLSMQGLPIQLDRKLQGAFTIYQEITREISKLYGVDRLKEKLQNEELVNKDD